MSIRTTILPNRERLLLVAESPCAAPDPWIAGYVVKSLRERLTYDSTMRHLEGITKGVRFCEARGVSDLRTLACGQELDDDFLSSFADDCRRRVDGAGFVTDPEQVYLAFTTFFVWLGDQPTIEARDRDQANLRRSYLLQRIEAHRPFATRDVKPRTGLSEGQRDLFLRAIIPTSPDNPFATSSYRNFALMGTAFMHGLRSGELLGLKLGDLLLSRGVAKIHVVLRPNDPDDPRKRPAAQKTQPRSIHISEDETQMLLQLLSQRDQLAASRKHPYVFCNADGAPLGDRGLRKAYEILRARHPSLGDLINHQLRHDWNDRWTLLVAEKGWDLDRALHAQLINNGWSPGSKMPVRYAKNAREELAGRYLVEAAERDFALFRRPQR